MALEMPIFITVFAILICAANGETLRDLLHSAPVALVCLPDQFQCNNGQCIVNSYMCDGGRDCNDGSDETYCTSQSGQCPTSRPFHCKNQGYYKCLPPHWVCDGINNCADREDEYNCNEVKNINQGTIELAKQKAQNWLHSLQKKERQFRKWGTDVSRIATVLFLANNTQIFRKNIINAEIAYEIGMEILSNMALKKMEVISSSELATHINALLVACVNPRDFFGVDLVEELRQRTSEQSIINPFVMLTLCNAEEKIMAGDVEKLLEVFSKASAKHWTDTQALTILALTCAASQEPNPSIDIQEVRDLTLEIKKRQFRNGTVENLKTTALVMQALFASETEPDEDNFDEKKAFKKILEGQLPDGSFQNFINTYYVLPVLHGRSLVNISSSHCKYPTKEEKEAFNDLSKMAGSKWKIMYSLWIGDNRTVERTLSLQVPANVSLYRLMEYAAGIDNRFSFQYSMRNGKPHTYAISGVQDDPENQLFWHPYYLTNSDTEALVPIEKSPVDTFPENRQHFVYWYKHRSWTSANSQD